MNDEPGDGCSGCLTLFLVVVVIALVVMAIISVAALVDPFSWMPPVAEIWEDCEEGRGGVDDCDLAARFPGFWGHTVANLAYLVVAVGLLAALASMVSELRAARTDRFKSTEAAERYGDRRRKVAMVAVLTVVVGMLPIVLAST